MKESLNNVNYMEDKKGWTLKKLRADLASNWADMDKEERRSSIDTLITENMRSG